MSLPRVAFALRNRGFASVSAVGISRKGLQCPAAPLALKSLSKTNGIQIATFDGRGPVSSLAVVLNLGSRHESPEAPGAAHLLKNVLVRNLPNDTLVRTIREAEFRGNTIYTSVSREHLVLASEFLRDDIVDVVPLLLNLLVNPSFEPYEFLDAIPNVLAESEANLEEINIKLWESAHSLAFRSGLGAPLFITPPAAANLTRASLTSLLNSALSSSRIAVVGTGIDHSDLTSLVSSSLSKLNKTFSESSAPASTKSSYFGGETRFDAGPSSEANYMVAFPTVGYTTSDYPASLVLSALLGGTSKAKWGNPSGLLATASTKDTLVSSELKSYADVGLIGLTATGKTGEVQSVIQKAVDTLKAVGNGTISEKALAGAKKAAVVGLETVGRDEFIKEVASQVLGLGSFSTTKEMAAKIEKVTVADVAKVAKSATLAKPSIVAHGNVAALPYADAFRF